MLVSWSEGSFRGRLYEAMKEGERFPQHHREASSLRPLYSSSRPMSITHFVSCPQQGSISSRPPIATKEVSRPPSSSASQCLLRGCKVRLNVPGSVSHLEYS